MRLGARLILFGALSIPLFQVSGVLEGQAAIAASAVATAVIGAGAAMLPTGAAAGASARILRLLPDQDAVADDQHAARNGHPDNGRSQPGLQRAPITTRHPRAASAMPRTLRQLWGRRG